MQREVKTGSGCPKSDVLPAANLTVTARVVTPDHSKTLLLQEGQSANLPAGTEVKVDASDAAWFDSWFAEKSLLTGSEHARDSFILTESTEIWGISKGTSSVEYPAQVSVSIAGGDEPLVVAQGVGEVSDRYIEVREGSFLSVEAASSPSPYYDTWLKLKLSRRDSTHAGRTATLDPRDLELVTKTSGNALYGYGTISAAAVNGLSLVSMDVGTKIEPFVDQVKYAIPYGPGVAWERSTRASFYLEPSCYVYDTDVPKASNLNPNPTAEAVVNPMSVLTIKPGECSGDCGLGEHGFVWIDNAKRYYIGPTATRANAELVGVSVGAAPGHVLKGLKISGGGQVWHYEGHGDVGDFISLEGMVPAMPDEDGLYTSADLYVEMGSDATIASVVDTLGVEILLSQGDRTILESSGDLDSDGVPDNVVPISVAPAMPTLTAALVPAGCGYVQWRLEVSFNWNRFTGINETEEVDDSHYYPGETAQVFTEPMLHSEPWTIGFGTDFVGGNATLLCRFGNDVENGQIVNPEELAMEFRILGTNPSATAISTQLGADTYRALAWHESGYRQFSALRGALNTPGGIGEPLPNSGDDGGYGLMQITSPPPTTTELWNWRANCDAGVTHFGNNITQSHNHVSHWPVTLTDTQHLQNAFCIYRSGDYYWIYVSGSGLVENPAAETGRAYADLMFSLMDTEPWED